MGKTLAHYTRLIGTNEGGEPVVSGTRFLISHLASEHAIRRWSAEEILAAHPDLTMEQVCAALAYYYDHRAEMHAEFEAADRAWREGKAASGQPSREELLRRLKP